MSGRSFAIAYSAIFFATVCCAKESDSSHLRLYEDNSKSIRDIASFDKQTTYGKLCARCHERIPSATRFSPWLLDRDRLREALSSPDLRTQSYAKEWFEKLTRELIDLESMPPSGNPEAELAKSNTQLAALKKLLADGIEKAQKPETAVNRQQSDPQQQTQPPRQQPVKEVATTREPTSIPPVQETQKKAEDTTKISRPHIDTSKLITFNDAATVKGVDGWEETPKLARNAVQILGRKKLKEYRDALPKVADARLARILRDPNTLFYDDDSVPKGYQDPSYPVLGVRGSDDPTVQQSALFVDPATGRLSVFSHGAGLNPSASTEAFYFLSLPKDIAKNELKKIKMERYVPGGEIDTGELWNWEYPPGTVSGEVLCQLDSRGRRHVVEIRTRTIGGPESPVRVDVLTAAPTKKDLENRLEEIAANRPELRKEALQVLGHLANSVIFPTELTNGGFQVGNFESRGATAYVPHTSEALTSAILETPFKSSLGSVWDTDGDLVAHSPTTDQEYSFVAHHSNRGAISTDSTACNRCHELGNTPIRDLFPDRRGIDKMLRRTTDLYGNTPGNRQRSGDEGHFTSNLRLHFFKPKLIEDFGIAEGYDNREVSDAFLPILDMTNAQ